MTQEEFLGLWSKIEDYPACDEGMVLLRQFAEASPTLFELAQRSSFIDPQHPAVGKNRLWQAYARHWSGCLKCNEI